jgi:hypothetical protein
MKITKFLFLLVFLMLIGLAFAQTYSITSHTINIQVEADGKASITERFYLYFPTNDDKVFFRGKSIEFGSSIEKWSSFNSRFDPTIGSNNLINGTISYNEGEENFLEIRYGLTDSIMAKGKETNLVVEYSIKANYFNKLFQSGIWIIPDNTDLTIELPPGADIRENIEPKAEIATSGLRKLVIWKGYKSGNRLNLDYVLWKKIDPVVDLNSLSTFTFRTSTGQIILVISTLIILGILWKRKKIANKIEEFVESNTKIEEE